jgi:uncharacterized membrane-anchored protein YhcB (DUF1043 family)
MSGWIAFFIGLVVGANIGLLLASMLRAGADKRQK